MTTSGDAQAVYSILDITVALATEPGILETVEASYGAFRLPPGDAPAAEVVIEAHEVDGRWRIAGGGEPAVDRPTLSAARLEVLDRLVTCVLRASYGRGRLTIHAAAMAGSTGAIILAGPSGHGKTTLALGLARRGFGLLSDELAVLDRHGRVLPYRRGLHVRPATAELLPELAFLSDRSRQELGGGSEWALGQGEVDALWQGGLAEPTPLAAAVLLEGQPGAQATRLTAVPTAIAALDLLRGSFAASLDFSAALTQLAACLDGVRCARLASGPLEETVDRLVDWMGEPRPRAGLAA